MRPLAETSDQDEAVTIERGQRADRLAVGVGRVPGPLRRTVIEVGQVGQLFVQLVYTAVRNPVGYWAQVRDEAYSMLRYSYTATLIAVAGFCFLIANLAYNLLVTIGAEHRASTYNVMAVVREIAPFVTSMAVAGVVGTALTADLGARRIREELDAMKVLGIDAVRDLVLPRVIAVTGMVVLFNVIATVIGVIMGLIVTTKMGEGSQGAYLANFLAIMTVPEVINALAKTAFTGLFIGVVCAHKGLTARGGSEGVGRAVNEAVVLCFAAIWIFNFVFNTITLGLNPEMLVSR